MTMSDYPEVFAPGADYERITMRGSDRRRDEEAQERTARVTKSHHRPETKHSICRKCLRPVHWRMDDRETTTTVWADFEIGTDKPHKCKV